MSYIILVNCFGKPTMMSDDEGEPELYDTVSEAAMVMDNNHLSECPWWVVNLDTGETY